MVGGISVVGCVTGTHIIGDINVVVPHRVAVFISAEQVLRSKDLHRALQQGRIMKLDGGSALRVESSGAPPSSDSTRVAQLEAEIQHLRRELEAALNREAGLQQVFASFGGQLAGIQGALGRLETRAPVTVGASAQNVSGNAAGRGVVGGSAPVFIPSQITPDVSESSIQVETSESGESSVTDARSRLRELRKKAEAG